VCMCVCVHLLGTFEELYMKYNSHFTHSTSRRCPYNSSQQLTAELYLCTVQINLFFSGTSHRARTLRIKPYHVGSLEVEVK